MRKNICNKFLTVALTLALLTASLTGCANNNANNKEEETTVITERDYSSLSEEEIQELYEKEPASKRTINISYDGGLCLAAIPVAQYKGFFEEEGLDTDLVAVGDNSRDALASGKIDSAVGMLTDWVTSIQNGVELQFTAALHTGCTSAAVLADSDITKFEKGQKVGISGPIGGYVHNIGLRFVSHDGFVADDFTWLALDASTVLSALQKGEVEVIVAGDQLIRQWENDGLVRTIRSQTTDADFKDEACCAFGFPKQFVDENPVTVYKITRALLKASNWIAESDANKEETVNICIDNGCTSGTPEYNLQVLKSLTFGLDYKALEVSLDNIVAEFVQLGILKADLDQEEFKKNILINYNLDDVE